ncbi:MAG TPA: hypothetical protein VFY23_06345 [Candidatus Limnocylindrales bacterium]|nr:hypothetical protein [Candidatus Limnocylindrales bacterium]
MPARPAKPKQAAKPKPPPKPWRREDGRYRSDDDRFTIESGGAGRWFLTDDASLDDLGLARTLGPYETLDAAKGAAAARRANGAEESPLADRLAATKKDPRARAQRAGTARDGEAAVRRDRDRERNPSPDAEPSREPAPEPEPPARTWLDDLEADDREAALAARRAIEALERLGISDAQAVVRRDVLGRQPAVAARLLGHALAAALRAPLEPAGLARDARSAIPGPMATLRDADPDALAAYTAFVAARVLGVTLEVVGGTEKAPGAPSALPGWRLVERPATRGTEPRRLIVTPADVTEG